MKKVHIDWILPHTVCWSQDPQATCYLCQFANLALYFWQTLAKDTWYTIVHSTAELRNVKFFTQTKIWVENFTPKTRNSQLICFRDKTCKSRSIQVVVGLVCYVRRPIGYLWAKCAGVWGQITPTKLSVFTKLYPTSEARMLHSKILPQTFKKFTQIYLPYLWHFATLGEVTQLSADRLTWSHPLPVN